MTDNGKTAAITPRNPFELKTKIIAPTADDGFLWPDGWTVTVQEIPYAVQQELQLAGVSDGTNVPTSKAEAKSYKIQVLNLDNKKGMLARMSAGIASWTFKNEKAQIVPISNLALEKLDGQSGAYIMEAINDLNPEVEDENEFPGDDGNNIQNGKR